MRGNADGDENIRDFFFQRFVLDTAGGAACHAFGNAGVELFETEGFHHVIFCAEIDRTGNETARSERAHHNDLCRSADLLEHSVAVQLGHNDIEQYHVGAVRVYFLESFLAVVRRRHYIVFVLASEVIGQFAHKLFVVVCYKNFSLH